MKLTTYLRFNGSCEAAFARYAEIFGGTVEELVRHGDSPIGRRMAPDRRNAILHARLAIGDQVLMGSDAPPDIHRPASGFYVAVAFDVPAEAERVFAALADGGQVRQPLTKTFFSSRFGMVADRFGILWMVLVSQEGR
jgi:PhnB protein